MDIGLGLDATLNLSFADQAALAQEAARSATPVSGRQKGLARMPSSSVHTAGPRAVRWCQKA